VNLNLLYRIGLILSRGENNSQYNIEYIRETLSTLSSLFSSQSLARAFIHFCRYRCSTAYVLQMKTGLPEASAYRALKRLRGLGLIEPVYRIPIHGLRKGGPRPIIWGLKGCYQPKDVARCIQHHRCLLSPKYRLAERLAQALLDQYIKPNNMQEISYKTILIFIRELRIPFNIYDIATLTANVLSERGIKVWR